MSRFTFAPLVVVLIVMMGILITGCAGAAGTPVPSATQLATATPTITPMPILALFPADARTLLSTDPKDASSKATLINQIQVNLESDVNGRSNYFDRDNIHFPIRFGVNTDVTGLTGARLTNPKFRGVPDPVRGFAVVGINCQMTTPDGVVHQILLTTQNQSLKSGWVAIDTTPQDRHYTPGVVLLGLAQGKGGTGYANVAWSTTIGELIEVRFPYETTPKDIVAGMLSQDEAAEYKNLEYYLLDPNRPRPSSIIPLSGLAQTTLSTMPAKYWDVVAFPSNG